jgi:acyl dehydratase
MHGDDMNMTPGDELPELRLPPIDRAVLAEFAVASGDRNPVHTDSDFARHAGLPDVIAHGMLGMAYVGRLLTLWRPQSSLRRFDVRFKAIMRLGDAPVLRGKVIEVAGSGGERIARVAVEMRDQNGEAKILGEALVAL